MKQNKTRQDKKHKPNKTELKNKTKQKQNKNKTKQDKTKKAKQKQNKKNKGLRQESKETAGCIYNFFCMYYPGKCGKTLSLGKKLQKKHASVAQSARKM